MSPPLTLPPLTLPPVTPPPLTLPPLIAPPVTPPPLTKPPPPLASFLGLRSRTLMFFLFLLIGLLSFLLVRVCYLRWITFTEQQLTPANDILFWNQIIKTDQFFLFALGPLT